MRFETMIIFIKKRKKELLIVFSGDLSLVAERADRPNRAQPGQQQAQQHPHSRIQVKGKI